MQGRQREGVFWYACSISTGISCFMRLLFARFSSTRSANLHNFSIFTSYFHFNLIWLHLSAAGGYQKVTSVLRHQSYVWIDYVGDIITRLF